jgi:hypothetical protein
VPVQTWAAEPLLRGLGVSAVKSAALSPLSLHPSPARRAASTLDPEGAEPVPSKSLALP